MGDIFTPEEWERVRSVFEVERPRITLPEIQTFTRDTVPWRIRTTPRTSAGALSEEQIGELEKRHDVPRDALRHLSRQLDGYLGEELHYLQLDLRPKARSKGKSLTVKAADQLASVRVKLEKVQALVTDVRFRGPRDFPIGPPMGTNHLESLAELLEEIASLESFYRTMAREDLCSVVGSPDKRLEKDVRREMVCTAIFGCWFDLDRRLTYTTDPITSARSGKLFEFANDVVRCVTDPPTALSGEALKAELDSFRSGIKP